MNITAENIIMHELVGLNARVIESSNFSLVGICGTIIDETKSMLRIRTIHGNKWIAKLNSIWMFSLGNKKDYIVNGSLFAKRSCDRINRGR